MKKKIQALVVSSLLIFMSLTGKTLFAAASVNSCKQTILQMSGYDWSKYGTFSPVYNKTATQYEFRMKFSSDATDLIARIAALRDPQKALQDSTLMSDTWTQLYPQANKGVSTNNIPAFSQISTIHKNSSSNGGSVYTIEFKNSWKQDEQVKVYFNNAGDMVGIQDLKAAHEDARVPEGGKIVASLSLQPDDNGCHPSLSEEIGFDKTGKHKVFDRKLDQNNCPSIAKTGKAVQAIQNKITDWFSQTFSTNPYSLNEKLENQGMEAEKYYRQSMAVYLKHPDWSSAKVKQALKTVPEWASDNSEYYDAEMAAQDFQGHMSYIPGKYNSDELNQAAEKAQKYVLSTVFSRDRDGAATFRTIIENNEDITHVTFAAQWLELQYNKGARDTFDTKVVDFAQANFNNEKTGGAQYQELQKQLNSCRKAQPYTTFADCFEHLDFRVSQCEKANCPRTVESLLVGECHDFGLDKGGADSERSYHSNQSDSERLD